MQTAKRCGPRPARRRALAWLGCAALGPALSGCGEPEPALNVGTIVFAGAELLFLARDKGWLPEPQIRLVELVSSADNLRALGDGKVDAVTMSLDEVVTARAEGVDLRIVAVLDISAGASAVMVRPGITELSALRGRRVGVEDNAMGVVMFDAMLSAARLGVEDVLKVPYTAERSVAMLQSGQIDAAVTFEPWVAQLEASGAHRLFDSRRIPSRILDVLAVRADLIAARPKTVAALVAGHFQALAHWSRNPKEAVELMAPRLQLEPDEMSQAFRGLELPDARRNRELLRADGALWRSVQEVQRVLLSRKLLREAVPAERLFDSRFLPV